MMAQGKTTIHRAEAASISYPIFFDSLRSIIKS
jgi:3-phosphoshikimate 1-carboxyvinyltransferase